MKVTIRFIGRTSLDIGRTDMEVELRNGAQLLDLVNHLLELLGPTAESALVDRKLGGYTVHFYVNGTGTNIFTVLNDGDCVVIVPPTFGG